MEWHGLWVGMCVLAPGSLVNLHLQLTTLFRLETGSCKRGHLWFMNLHHSWVYNQSTPMLFVFFFKHPWRAVRKHNAQGVFLKMGLFICFITKRLPSKRMRILKQDNQMAVSCRRESFLEKQGQTNYQTSRPWFLRKSNRWLFAEV